MLAIVTMGSCEKADFQEVPQNKDDEAAKELLSKGDQISATVTARPLSDRIAYDITIKNTGSEVLWIWRDPINAVYGGRLSRSDWCQWLHNPPIRFKVGLRPDEEFSCEANPISRGPKMYERFGFEVVQEVESDDPTFRQVLIWSDARSAANDFGYLLDAVGSPRSEAEQGEDTNAGNAPE